MKIGTMYENSLGRFTLVKIVDKVGDLDVWEVADVATGAVRQVDEDEIFAADELPAQVGQAWVDDDAVVTLVACRRFGGIWVWNVIDSDLGERQVSEGALLAYYARVDGLNENLEET